MEEKTYVVAMSVNARYYARVTAKSPKEALDKAPGVFMEADIGDLECVDSDVVHVEDQDGNIIDPSEIHE